MDKFVHVNIGSTNGVLPVIALYTEGCFKDFYELRTPKGHFKNQTNYETQRV